jgi:hypothetical protein
MIEEHRRVDQESEKDATSMPSVAAWNATPKLSSGVVISLDLPDGIEDRHHPSFVSWRPTPAGQLFKKVILSYSNDSHA